MTFAQDQSRAAENRCSHDCHAWGDDDGADPDALSAARPLVWLCVAFVVVTGCALLVGWLA